MKILLRLTIAAFGLAIFNLSTVVVEGQSYTNNYGIWGYTINNGTITITGYTGPGGDVTIPSVIDGLPITSIGDYSFEWCGLTSVTIPNSVTSIGNSAFWECRSLSNVTIPNSVTSIGEGAFTDCSSLTDIEVAPLNSFYSSVDGVLFDKSQTTLVEYPAGIGGSYTIPNGITTIGNSAFSGCISLTSVIIPNSLTSIGEYAFNGCGLTSVTIPNSVTSIGDSAFISCSSLTSVTIPNSVTSIGDSAFSFSALTNVTIPDSVISIGDSAFENCGILTSVIIPNSVTSIGEYAFDGCRLTSVTIPNSVTNIGDGAFWGCSSLTAIMVDTNNPAYTSLNGILFNKSQTTLVQYPAGIGGSYTIPNGITTIGNSAFSGNLTSVTIPNSVTSIGTNAFFGCSLTNVTIPNSVTTIVDYAFYYCISLTNVTIGNGVISIGNGAFFECVTLTDITIPNSVTNIGDSAFGDCYSLASVTMGNGVISIGNSAFAGCGSLTNVTIPKSVTNIGGAAFGSCWSLTAITVDTNNPAYTSLNGILFNKSQTTLVEYPTGIGGSYTIPNGVTFIGDSAFNAYGLSSVTIPNSVTNIGDSAFAGCGTLTSVYFQGNTPSCGVAVFFVDVMGQSQHWDPVTVYYLPGTTGWGPTFGGRPTALWLPQVQTSDAYFGVWADQFGFTINWTSGMTVVVEASTSLSTPSWVPLETHTLRGNSWFFSDPDWANYPARFYRIRMP